MCGLYSDGGGYGPSSATVTSTTTITQPYLSVITHRWVGIVFGYGYEYYQDKLDALAESSLRIELDNKRKSKANLDNCTEIVDSLAENSLRIEFDNKRKSKANLDNYIEI